jgi:radical SAM protein with 4Fe4S-binding SPASM domain
MRKSKAAFAARLRLLKCYASGKEVTGSGPSDVLIEVTSRCNLACPECRREEFVSKLGHMSWNVFESALDSAAPDLELAFLFGWGEPLLWPRLVAGIEFARARGIRTSLSTNITLLKGALARKLAACGPDILTLALDSHLKNVYEHYRRGASLERTLCNLRDFFAECKRARSKSRIVLQMICSPEASRDAAGYKAFAGQFPGIDIRYRLFKPAHAVSAPPERRPCPILWRGPAYVRSDGQVFPCCILQDQPLGSVMDSSLRALWNSKRMRSLRKLHAAGRINELKECSTCYHTDPQEYPRYSVLAGFLFASYRLRRIIPIVETLRMARQWIKSLFASKPLISHKSA